MDTHRMIVVRCVYLALFCVSNRREAVVEALKHIDGSSETVVNSLKEYVVMNTTLKSILPKVPLATFFFNVLSGMLSKYGRIRSQWEDRKTIALTIAYKSH